MTFSATASAEYTEYSPDRLSLPRTFAGMAAAAMGGGALSLAAWTILKSTSLPSFNTSMVTRSLATAGSVMTLVAVAVVLWLWIHRSTHRPAWLTFLSYGLCYLAPAALVISSLGLPLAATRLWLDGIQVDQTFRTQFLMRMTQQLGWADMNYVDLPTFYPAGWFWGGAVLARILGIPGWEAFQPWSLMSLAMAGCLLVPLWQRLVGSLPVATAIALMTTAVALTIGAHEPYSTVIAMGAPAVVILGAHAFSRQQPTTLQRSHIQEPQRKADALFTSGAYTHPLAAAAGIAVYLGLSATFYTLYTGVMAMMVTCLIAVVYAIGQRSYLPIFRLIGIGISALAIAALAWAPYILAVFRADYPTEAAAQRFLPAIGTEFPVPFFSPTIIGALCLLGVIYMTLRIENTYYTAMSLAVLGVYSWVILSQLVSVIGQTLLSFRLEIVLVLFFATTGILAIADLRLVCLNKLLAHPLSPRQERGVSLALIVVISLSAIHYVQSIPVVNQTAIDHAYSDTDGYGERGDRRPGDSSAANAEIDQYLQQQGYQPADTVVLTEEATFLAYYPYYGFNAMTAHYANPLGQFSTRSQQVAEWAEQSYELSPEQFYDSVTSSPWRGPDVIIFRGQLSDPATPWLLHINEDTFPAEPNVRFIPLNFNPEAFADDSLWNSAQIGPFIVVSRA